MKRSRFELCLEVLASIKNSPQKITQMMFATKCNCSIVKELTEHLEQRGLLRIVSPDRPNTRRRKYAQKNIVVTNEEIKVVDKRITRFFKITPKGLEVLQHYKVIREELKLW